MVQYWCRYGKNGCLEGNNDMKDYNTVKACHFSVVKGKIVAAKKLYSWHIPKDLRYLNIQKGDIVYINARDKRHRVIVAEVFREDIEETGRRYRPIYGRAKKGKRNCTEK